MSDVSENKSIQLAGRNSLQSATIARVGYLNTPLDGGAGLAQNSGGTELKRIKQMMRGRWGVAVGVTLLGSCLGGLLGFRSGHKIYASTGQIRVVAVVPKVLYSVEDKEVPQMFDSFVESQVALLQSQRVMELAAQDPAWRAVGRTTSDANVQSLMHSTEVSHSGELITLKTTDLDPNVAVTTVRSVINAFEKIYEESDAESNEKRLVVLQNIQATKGNELAAIREEISDIARPYGTDDLQQLFSMKQSAVEKMDTTISDLDADLATAVRNRAGNHLPEQLTSDQWAAVSPEMAGLIHDRSVAIRNVELLRATNVGDNSKQMVASKAVIAIDDKAIREVAEQLQAQRAAGLLVFPGGEASGSAGNRRALLDPDSLRDQIENLRKRRDTARVEMIAVGDQQLKISDLKYKADQAIREREAAQQRIDQLNTEATINGRVVLVSDGDRPLSPYKDTHVTFAAAGIAGGGLLGFACMLTLAAFDHRLRSPDETSAISPGLVLLGLLPRLPKDLSDDGQDARAAHCVTGVRNLLHLSVRSEKHKVFVITSPVTGAGKTSLTFALGVSYATARFKVLMIDCDLVGGGLTARADKIITRKLGQLLQREGQLSDKQLKEALVVAKERHCRLGEFVVERGWVSQNVVDRLLIAQVEESVGLLDAIDGTPLDQCVTPTGIMNLWLLPIGKAKSRDVPLLSLEVLGELLERARKEYDVVLVDTGPVPGSLEAQLVAAVADSAVVVVSAGAHRRLVHDCINRLNGVGARVAGIVYNRASDSEVFMYTSGSQPHVARKNGSSTQMHNTADLLENQSTRTFGPLASAVSRVAPVSRPARPDEKLNDRAAGLKPDSD